MAVGNDSPGPWAEKYDQIVEDALRERARRVVAFGSVMYVAFAAMDLQVYPDLAREFIAQRVGVAFLLVGIVGISFVKRSKFHSIWLMNLAVAVVAASIEWMIYRSDGVSSPYYQGVNIVLLAMVSVNSFKWLHDAVLGVIIIVGYLTAIFFNATPINMPDLSVALSFIITTLVFVVMMARLYGHQHYQQFLKSMRLKQYAVELNLANQRLKATEQLKDDFFANVSHELRTPLALVLGPARKLARQGDLCEARRHDAQVIEKNAMTLLRHVNQLLDVSRLDAKRVPVESDAVDLVQLIRFVCSHFEAISDERGIDLRIEAPERLVVSTDGEKVQRIIFNLLSNAFKFTPSGGRIQVALAAVGGKARISIEDSGPGVPPEMRAMIFERFRQGHTGSIQRYGGTGLGLAIASEFARLLGGDVDLDPARQHGAMFVVTLPLACSIVRSEIEPPGEPQKAGDHMLSLAEEVRVDLGVLAADGDGPILALERREPEAQPNRVTAASILIVEDNREMGRFIMDILGEVAQVFLVASGIEALQQVRWRRPDLIITDVMMPGMGGVELVSALQRDESLNDIPILVLTAKADLELKTELLAKGVQDYLHKPFMAEELTARACNLLAMKRVRDVLSRELKRRESDLVSMAEELASGKRTTETALLAAEAAASAKDEFLMNLSHELRTPLTSILGWSEYLGSRDEGHFVPRGEEVKEGMDAVHRNARSLLRLVNDLLDLSRVVQGKLSLDLKPTVISEPIESALESVAVTARTKDVQLQRLGEGDSSLRSVVMGDSERLQQVMWNLLSNAVKFTPPGGRVSVRTQVEANEVVIEVQDTGQGISPQFLPHVFERLRQEDSSIRKRHAGLGLGLAIARHLVELHGGQISAHSDGAGRGATFNVRLPVFEKGERRSVLTPSDDVAKMDQQYLHS